MSEWSGETDRQGAIRTGYVAGYGLAMLVDKGECANVHTPWSNYVPTWVEANVDSSGLVPLFREAFERGIAQGREDRAAGIANGC